MMLFTHKWNKSPFSEQESYLWKKLLLCKKLSNKYDLLTDFPTTMEMPVLTKAAEAHSLEYPSRL